jgi:pre-mRNA-splicing factor ATP-dependent RNA helicase DHX15/PRP43
MFHLNYIKKYFHIKLQYFQICQYLTDLTRFNVDLYSFILSFIKIVEHVKFKLINKIEVRESAHELFNSITRFDSSISENTKIKIVTDGILLNEIMNNAITKYSVIIIDEIHLRSINIDLILCLLNFMVFNKCNIKIIIMSATIEVAKFQKFFNIAADCVINVVGKIFPVDIFYVPVDVIDYFKYSINIVEQILKFETKTGDILIFLNGKEEILTACNEINNVIYGLGMEKYIKCLPLYSSMDVNKQKDIFEVQRIDPNYSACVYRKIIIATNIAETSLTIDGVVIVIDCGYVKLKSHNNNTDGKLEITRICKNSSKQRAGRAGRTRRGMCYRLYTKNMYDKDMLEEYEPEIVNTDLSTVILQFNNIGINLEAFLSLKFISAPTIESVVKSVEQLFYLEAIDDKGIITNIGKSMSKFQMDVKLARCLHIILFS